ncbi:MAG: NosD domain-containing protein [Candidatus Bathyarchaeia archaeon]
MNKQFAKLAAGLIALLLCGVSFISSTSSNARFSLLNSTVTSTNIVYVDINTPAPDQLQNGSENYAFRTIQRGIDNASAGDTVFVRKGHYYETVTIPNSLNLVGADRDKTIIDGENERAVGNVVDILGSASIVSISNLTIENAKARPNCDINLEGPNDQVKISENKINGSDIGIIIGYNCQNITITRNDIEDEDGIKLTNNTDVNISENIISGVGQNLLNDAGIQGSVSHNITIIGNNISDVFFGIETESSWGTDVIGNIETNVTKALEMTSCYDSTVEDNIMNGTRSRDEFGIVIERFYDPLPESNTLSNNTLDGFYCGMDLLNVPNDMSYEANNTVAGNKFSNCNWGLYVDYNLSSNYIYHNNFDHNTDFQAVDHGYNNHWSSYPCGGNYWSDYNGTDTHWGENQDKPGIDRIGDTAYKNGTVTDGYPLMQQLPMSNFSYWEYFSVAAITSSSITNFAFDNSTGISFNINTTETNAFCEMIIPKSLLDGAFNFFVDNGSAVCCFGWSPQCHMINFTYAPGYHYVNITAEFVNSPLRDFPDLNGDGKVNLPDLTILAQHYRWVKNSTYCGPP